MEKFDQHPTWQMLEESKKAFKDQINTMPAWHPHRFLIEELHQRLIKLQYKLEARLVEEGFER